MANVTYKEANRRYRRAFIPVMVFYSVTCFAGPMGLSLFDEPPKWAMALVAVATAAPLTAVFVLMGRWLKETDEYTRAKAVEALLAGAGMTISIAVTWGFLELFKLVPNMWTFLIGPIFFASYGLASLIGHLRGGRVVS